MSKELEIIEPVVKIYQNDSVLSKLLKIQEITTVFATLYNSDFLLKDEKKSLAEIDTLLTDCINSINCIKKDEESKREQIAYMLAYYAQEKELLSCEDLYFGIKLLLQGRNPFVNKDFVSVLNAAADKKNYPLSHEVFSMKLPGDES